MKGRAVETRPIGTDGGEVGGKRGWARWQEGVVPGALDTMEFRRLPCFAGEVDYVRHRQEPQEAALRHGCAIHAYVLMTNHVHLLVSLGGGDVKLNLEP